MAGPENTGLASERNPNCAVVVGKQPAARVNLRIHPRSTRRCWAGCRWPVGWRNKCCSKCDRGLNRHSPSRRTNWAWATCSSTACGSPGRWPCWRMRRDCCERERCWGDHPCARCWQTCCPANCRWNWGGRTPCHSYINQTQTHKIPNEINVSHFGFRNTLYDLNNLDEKTAKKYCYTDHDGRRFTLGDLNNPNPDRPNLTYDFLGHHKVWRWTKERMEASYKAGRSEEHT